jgi:uncharacterized damage-inducible protein DinB
MSARITTMSENSAIAAVAAPHDPDLVASERQTLVEFLEYYRTVLLRKAAGLDRAQLAVSVGASSLTIGGLIKHMAFVEHGWFRECWLGEGLIAPWSAVDWSATPDWELESAAHDSPDELARLYLDSIERSRAAIADAHDLSATVRYRDREWSLRWILVHMIEEYARHCGHADLIREAVDGQTGD